MRFKTDENLPLEVCDLLQEAGHNAVSLFAQQFGGRPDCDVALICRSENRALITLDNDFADILTYPPDKYPGIIVIRSEKQSKPSILAFIIRIIEVIKSETVDGKLWIIEQNRIRVRGPK